MTFTGQPTVQLAEITIVESSGCHFCVDAHEVLDELSQQYPLRVITLDVHTDRGRDLMASHRAALSPLVLLDGEFFSHGRLPRRKLAKVLARRFDTPTGQRGARHG